MSDKVVELEPDDEFEPGDYCCLTPTDDEMVEGRKIGEETDPESDDIEDEEETAFYQHVEDVTERHRAMHKAREMKAILLEHGVPEVKIVLHAGRPSRYGRWDAGFFVSDMSHHIVSRFGQNKTPGLALVINGRSDLAGPLANGYGGFDLCYRIITFGYANHPGYGGPITLPALTAGTFTIPKDSARRYAWGTEWEGGLNEGDWDRRLRNPRNGARMTMREFMGRVNAGLEKALEIHEFAHMEHSTWTSRKIDRLGYTAAKGIAEKEPYRERPVYRLRKVDLSNIRKQFRIGLGLENGELKSLPGIRVIQRNLNRKTGEKLEITGKADKPTLNAWGRFEKSLPGGVVGRPRVPDEKTLPALAATFVVKD